MTAALTNSLEAGSRLDALNGAAAKAALSASKRDPASNELVKAAVIDFETPQGRIAVQQALRTRCANCEPSELVQRSLACLRDVSKILDTKAPGDAKAFKAWLQDISQKVADASVEGTFLGFGGVRVSDSEKPPLPTSPRAWVRPPKLRRPTRRPLHGEAD